MADRRCDGTRGQPSGHKRSALVAVAVLCCAAVVAAGGARAVTGPLPPSHDPFYSYAGSVAAFAPGAVLRSRTVTFDDAGVTLPIKTSQVLYRTTSELGRPSIDVATVIQPLLDLQPNKLISWQMAYDGLASNCEPSYAIQGGTPTEGTNNEEQALMVTALLAGYTIVTADYEGEANDFAAGRVEGYGTLDGIRAAERLLGVPAATTRVALVGYSGGAIASDWAAELAPSYAPELNLVGTAMGGIAVDLAHNLPYVNGSQVWSGAIPAALVGIARAFKINLAAYLSPHGMQIADAVGRSCLGSDLGSYPGLTYQQLLKPQYTDIDQIAPAVRALDALIMSTGGTPREPLFMGVGNADGIGDGVMVAADDEGLAHIYCGRGVPVQFSVYKGDDHATAAVQFLPGAIAFVLARLNGAPFTNGCATIGTGNSLAPLRPASSAAPRWRLTATPAVVRRLRSTRVRFQLTETIAGAVRDGAGARIRFARRTMTTGRGGTATVTVSLRVHHGRVYIARASVAGKRVAVARVRVIG